MATLDYPSSLPNPTQAAHTPKARVSTTDLPGAESYSQREQDYTGVLDVEFFFDSTQVATFYQWWTTTLLRGGMGFNCSWPALRSGPMTVFFVGAPKYTHVYMGAYKVTAQVSVRGTSLQVVGCKPNPYYGAPSSTLLYISGDGFPNSTNIVDNGPYNKTVTGFGSLPAIPLPSYAFGSAQVGNSSLKIDQTVQGALVNASGEALLDRWTWQTWFNATNQTGGNGFLAWGGAGGTWITWREPANSGTYQLAVVVNGSYIVTGATSIPANTWTHLAVSVDFNSPNYTVRLFINGNLDATFTGSNSAMRLTPVSWGIGYNAGNRLGCQGLINEYIVSAGCLYKASFTPPSTKHVPVGVAPGTSLVLHAQAATDSSIDPKTVTLTGSASVSTAAYKYDTASFLVPNPGSSTLNGIVVTSTTSTALNHFEFYLSDFHIRIWALRLSNSFLGTLLYIPFSGNVLFVKVDTAGHIRFNAGTANGSVANADTGAIWPLNVFCEMVVQRRGGVFEIFLNGARVYSVAVPGGSPAIMGFLNGGSVYLGRTDASSAEAWNGYIAQTIAIRNTALSSTGSYSTDPVPVCDFA